MKSNILLSTALLVAFTCVGATGAPQVAAPYLHNDSVIRSLKASYGRAFDIKFLSQSIEHHRGSIALARQGLRVSNNVAVRQLARAVIQRDEHEIRLLTGFLKSRYRTTPSVSEALLVRKDMEERMKNPIATERGYVNQMVGHEQEEVQMGQLVLKHSKSDALIRLARTMVAHSRADIQRLVNLDVDVRKDQRK